MIWYGDRLTEDLSEMVTDWHQARRIREFLTEYERRIPTGSRGEKCDAWIRATANYAERLDPLNDLANVAKDLEPSDEELERLISEVEEAKRKRQQSR